MPQQIPYLCVRLETTYIHTNAMIKYLHVSRYASKAYIPYLLYLHDRCQQLLLLRYGYKSSDESTCVPLRSAHYRERAWWQSQEQNKRLPPQRTGLGHAVVVSEFFLERLDFLGLTDSVVPSLSDKDESLCDFLPRLTFLSSFSEPNDSRLDFRRCRCGAWLSCRYFLVTSQNNCCRSESSGYLQTTTIKLKNIVSVSSKTRLT